MCAIILLSFLVRWLYLEPVFSKGTLSKEAGRFRRLDADFRFIIGEIKRDNRVTTILRISNLRSLVTNLLDQVGRCQKSLYEFLEVIVFLFYKSTLQLMIILTCRTSDRSSQGFIFSEMKIYLILLVKHLQNQL